MEDINSMDNIVSARRLRKSALKKINSNGIEISNFEIGNKIKEHENFDLDSVEDSKKLKFSFKKKLFIKFFLSINIVFLTLICKLTLKDQVLNNKYAKIVINQYEKDYSKLQVLEKLEKFCNDNFKTLQYIIPNKFLNYINYNYSNFVKEKIINFDVKEEIFSLLNGKENNVNDISNNSIDKNNQEEISGIGGGDPIEATNMEEVASTVSTMENNVDEILNKKINIILPVNGKITSRYGAREQIFDNVNPYHTGIDIANILNTQVTSSTDGIVKKVEEMNKYYGNNVEIETDGVIFKYAHLNKIQVKQGSSIKQGENVGLMGSTGMSTGPHLHFEIKINGNSVDPEKILDFNRS